MVSLKRIKLTTYSTLKGRANKALKKFSNILKLY